MMKDIKIKCKIAPVLDPGFVPAVLWNKAYNEMASKDVGSENISIVLGRPDGTRSVTRTKILPHNSANRGLNVKYLERMVKFLLWMKGGAKVVICGNKELAMEIGAIYSNTGKRAFDSGLIGRKVYGKPIEVAFLPFEKTPAENEASVKLGGNWDGCRIGFDLGGSDRKCAAVIDGEVVFTEEVGWDPYFQKDPKWHLDGINDSLKSAAEKMPRVDAIGGSSAGVYVNNQVRVASLFRGVSEENFKKHVVNIFFELQEKWNNVPFIVVNDGEVTALAGAMSLKTDSLLGISMGTSLAGGYVTPSGTITNWLNELAFAPIDYRDGAPADEWSGDIGCGVQYFSQQAVARLAPLAGIKFDSSMPLAERLLEVQKLMKDGNQSAADIYRTIGTYFGYAVAHYADFYEIKDLLILGRVTSGAGGEFIISGAKKVLEIEFPELYEKIRFSTPDEKNKRHGQAVAAASLPEINIHSTSKKILE